MYNLRWLFNVERGHPHLAVFQERQATVLGYCRRIALGYLLWHSAVERNDEYSLLWPLGQALWVRDVTMSVKIAATSVNERAPVGRPGNLTDVLPVISLVRSQPAAPVFWCRGYPYVTGPALVENPGDLSPARRRHQF